MRQVGIARRRVFKGYDKAVCEALAQSLGARIHAPRQPENSRYLPRQILDDPPHIGDVPGSAGGLEFEEGDVFDASHGEKEVGEYARDLAFGNADPHTSI